LQVIEIPSSFTAWMWNFELPEMVAALYPHIWIFEGKTFYRVRTTNNTSKTVNIKYCPSRPAIRMYAHLMT
jgi:hypothetical protein